MRNRFKALTLIAVIIPASSCDYAVSRALGVEAQVFYREGALYARKNTDAGRCALNAQARFPTRMEEVANTRLTLDGRAETRVSHVDVNRPARENDENQCMQRQGYTPLTLPYCNPRTLPAVVPERMPPLTPRSCVHSFDFPGVINPA